MVVNIIVLRPEGNMRNVVLVLVCAVISTACGGARIDRIRAEKEEMRRRLVVCSDMYRHDREYCERQYGDRLYALECQEAELAGEQCKPK